MVVGSRAQDQADGLAVRENGGVLKDALAEQDRGRRGETTNGHPDVKGRPGGKATADRARVSGVLRDKGLNPAHARTCKGRAGDKGLSRQGVQRQEFTRGRVARGPGARGKCLCHHQPGSPPIAGGVKESGGCECHMNWAARAHASDPNDVTGPYMQA